MKHLLALAAALGMCGCVSLKTHREAVKMAEMRGKLEGQLQVLPIAEKAIEMARSRCGQSQDQGMIFSPADDMEALAAEAAMETNRMVGPPPELKKTELPSRGRKER